MSAQGRLEAKAALPGFRVGQAHAADSGGGAAREQDQGPSVGAQDQDTGLRERECPIKDSRKRKLLPRLGWQRGRQAILSSHIY